VLVGGCSSIPIIKDLHVVKKGPGELRELLKSSYIYGAKPSTSIERNVYGGISKSQQLQAKKILELIDSFPEREEFTITWKNISLTEKLTYHQPSGLLLRETFRDNKLVKGREVYIKEIDTLKQVARGELDSFGLDD